jgi:hypothetical protein
MVMRLRLARIYAIVLKDVYTCCVKGVYERASDMRGLTVDRSEQITVQVKRGTQMDVRDD